MSRDTKDAATRIALVPEHDEIDWQLSKWATDLLELGTLSFEHEIDGARWVRSLTSWRWYSLGDGRAALQMPLEPDTIMTPTTFLRVGELLYRVGTVTPGPSWGYVVELQLVDVCAPVDEQAEDADDLWRRPEWSYAGDGWFAREEPT